MKNKITRFPALGLAAVAMLATLNLQPSTAHAQGTAFTYQGKLVSGADAANGVYDLRFWAFDYATNGMVLGGPITNTAVVVTNGLFITTVDFGAGIFTGAARWLQIDVRTNGSWTFTNLFPRQPILPAPYAVMANSASNLLGNLSGAQLNGVVSVANGGTGASSLPANSLLLGNGVSAVSAVSGGTAAGQVLAFNGSAPAWSSFGGDVSGSPGALTLASSGVTAGSYGSASAVASFTVDAKGRLTAANNATIAIPATQLTGTLQLGQLPAGVVTNNEDGVNLVNLTLGGNLNLPATTASAGVIYSGGSAFLQAYGSGNLFAGVGAGSLSTTGTGNTGVGYQAFHTAGYGAQNTACGYQALYSNSSGTRNVGMGYQALYQDTQGYDNAVLGYEALYADGSCYHDVAIGSEALYHANSGAHDNIAIGYMAGYNIASSAQNNINIGNQGAANQNNSILIGTQGTQTSTYIAGIYGTTVSSPGAAVYVNSSGQLGTATSSRRFKTDIQDMNTASDGLLALRPVTFKYKTEIDPNGFPQFGLVAEEVEKVNPDLVIHGDAGKPYTVRYEAVNAMLLNEFLKEHKTVESQKAELQAQGAEIQDLKQSVAELKSLVENLAGK